uniref:(northern house mosquito) hypothetical protein n=1 Tax=Culex pipiens TaxID=7175 RepID=A0A8D8BTB2_CULPI
MVRRQFSFARKLSNLFAYRRLRAAMAAASAIRMCTTAPAVGWSGSCLLFWSWLNLIVRQPSSWFATRRLRQIRKFTSALAVGWSEDSLVSPGSCLICSHIVGLGQLWLPLRRSGCVLPHRPLDGPEAACCSGPG